PGSRLRASVRRDPAAARGGPGQPVAPRLPGRKPESHPPDPGAESRPGGLEPTARTGLVRPQRAGRAALGRARPEMESGELEGPRPDGRRAHRGGPARGGRRLLSALRGPPPRGWTCAARPGENAVAAGTRRRGGCALPRSHRRGDRRRGDLLLARRVTRAKRRPAGYGTRSRRGAVACAPP